MTPFLTNTLPWNNGKYDIIILYQAAKWGNLSILRYAGKDHVHVYNLIFILRKFKYIHWYEVLKKDEFSVNHKFQKR